MLLRYFFKKCRPAFYGTEQSVVLLRNCWLTLACNETGVLDHVTGIYQKSVVITCDSSPNTDAL